MYLKRIIQTELKKHLSRKEYSILTGARQSGKTSLIKAIYKELQDENKNVAYITLEDNGSIQ